MMTVYRSEDCAKGNMLGEGTFAQVFDGELVVEPGIHKRVAFKIVKPESSIDFTGCEDEVCYADVLDAFRSECSVLVALGAHPNVVPVLGIIETGETLVMERAAADLSSAIADMRGHLRLMCMSGWAKDILAGIDFIHSRGVIHQDMKTSNILISRTGTAQICDFGLSCCGSGKLSIDREIGTLWYRAAEVLMGASTYTPKIDEWGVGCILLEMFLGQPVFNGNPLSACGCAAVSHRNFNADQMLQVFRVCGTPDERALRGMACAAHFAGWDVYEPAIFTLVEEACTMSSVKEGPEQIRAWAALISGLLDLSPKRRLSARSALASNLFAAAPPQPAAKSKREINAATTASDAHFMAAGDDAASDATALDGAFVALNAAAPAQPRPPCAALTRTCSAPGAVDGELAGNLKSELGVGTWGLEVGLQEHVRRRTQEAGSEERLRPARKATRRTGGKDTASRSPQASPRQNHGVQLRCPVPLSRTASADSPPLARSGNMPLCNA